MLTTRDSNARMKSIYEDRALPLSQLFEINDRMVNNTVVQYDAVTNGRAGKPIGDVAGKVGANSEAISKVWGAYVATYLTPEEKAVADSFVSKRKKYLDEAIRPALAMLNERKYDEAATLLAGKAGDVFASIKQDIDKLVAIQVKEAKAEYDAATSQYISALAIVSGALIVALLFGGLFGRQAIRVVVRPLNTLNQAMLNLTQGKLDNRMPVERDDEIGEAVRNMQNVQAIVRFNSNEVVALQKRSAEQRKADMSKLAADFEGAVSEIIETVSSAATELEASAGTLSSTAERSQQLASSVAAASEEASTNVQSVASASEELTSSVNEISRQVQESARIANAAVDQARITNDRVNELSKAAARIGDVVELINNIAGQTNLLALNATIEAARAGEAGRGFAVVASEVKALAEQTAKATGEIGQQISGIQAATGESVIAIKEISTTIERLSEISSTIAAAVEEQGLATKEISSNAQMAAQVNETLAANLTSVNRAIGETRDSAGTVLTASGQLAGEADKLTQAVTRFFDKLRSDIEQAPASKRSA